MICNCIEYLEGKEDCATARRRLRTKQLREERLDTRRRELISKTKETLYSLGSLGMFEDDDRDTMNEAGKAMHELWQEFEELFPDGEK